MCESSAAGSTRHALATTNGSLGLLAKDAVVTLRSLATFEEISKKRATSVSNWISGGGLSVDTSRVVHRQTVDSTVSTSA
jgi:hypothetical protein